MYKLRKANSKDAAAIRRLVWAVQINPTGLNWRHFLVAVDLNNKIIGCGQMKPHSGGLLELASIAVRPEYRSLGIARRIIEQLIMENPTTLYLYCRSRLQPFYEKFGFTVCPPTEMPAYFHRIWSFAHFVLRLTQRDESLLVMRRS
jgi:N-acetylglutamate synthase-like GNAT family acetyltransferase